MGIDLELSTKEIGESSNHSQINEFYKEWEANCKRGINNYYPTG